MRSTTDVIVVGSGLSAVHAAHPLVEAGHTVLMLDVGNEDQRYASLIPDNSFVELRQTDLHQHRYFLGDEFEGIPAGTIGTGPQVTPPRQFVLRHAETLTPSRSRCFTAAESLALGGLAGAWGAVSFPFTDGELRDCGLDAGEMRQHYEIVARRIGISGGRDDLNPLHGSLDALQPPLKLDHNAERMLSRYQSYRESFRGDRVALGRPLLAALSRQLGDRSAHAYQDMDFWSNSGDSVYRADLTVRALQQRANFTYRRPCLVTTFCEETGGAVTVTAKDLDTSRVEVFTARRLVLAAGALGTTRIVLRSLNRYDTPVPLVCNSHTYIPSLHYRGLGRTPSDRCHSLAQLTMIYDPTGDARHLAQAQSYSYRSLLLFRLLKESKFPCRESLRIMRELAPALVILVVQFEDRPGPGKQCCLRRGVTGEQDVLEIQYQLSEQAEDIHRKGEQTFVRCLRRLGCWPLKIVHPGHGSSIHYAGQLPTGREEKPLTTEPSGLLRGTRTVFIADGAALAYLPAKGLSFTLMANANRVGTFISRQLRSRS